MELYEKLYEVYNSILGDVASEGYTIFYFSGEIIKVWNEHEEKPEILEINTRLNDETYSVLAIRPKRNFYVLIKYTYVTNETFYELHQITPNSTKAERIMISGYAPVLDRICVIDEEELEEELEEEQ